MSLYRSARRTRRGGEEGGDGRLFGSLPTVQENEERVATNEACLGSGGGPSTLGPLRSAKTPLTQRGGDNGQFPATVSGIGETGRWKAQSTCIRHGDILIGKQM